MKRITVLLVALILPVAAFQAAADKGEGHGAHKANTQKTITGEVVDTGCFMSHGGRGAKHADCATKCIAQGMPMGLLTSDGTLYLLTLNHDNADPYNELKEMAGKMVSVTGSTMTRGGMKGIDVAAVKAAPSPGAK